MSNQFNAIDTIGTLRPLSGFGGSVVRAVRRGVNVLLTWQQRARERQLLACMDDHILRDLGLSRADVMREHVKPFWRP
jgi:uncharacterized protein YjiS (DUF1127 family)